MTTNINDLVRALGAVIEGVENDTVLMALGALTVKHIINTSKTEKEAYTLSSRFGSTLMSAVAQSFSGEDFAP
jgi:uncharacterized protein YejL (UPF0352 family)